jgi:hypothetical protein
MLRLLGTALAVLALTTCALSVPVSSPPPVSPGVTLIGKGLVSGSALDKSGLAGNICQQGAPANCVPKAIFGGFGSDLTYTGHDNVFIAAPDQGPFDGLTDVPYLDRFHFLHITTDLGAPFPNINTEQRGDRSVYRRDSEARSHLFEINHWQRAAELQIFAGITKDSGAAIASSRLVKNVPTCSPSIRAWWTSTEIGSIRRLLSSVNFPNTILGIDSPRPLLRACAKLVKEIHGSVVK